MFYIVLLWRQWGKGFANYLRLCYKVMKLKKKCINLYITYASPPIKKYSPKAKPKKFIIGEKKHRR